MAASSRTAQTHALGGWACQACTVLNEADDVECHVCQTSRPPRAEQVAAPTRLQIRQVNESKSAVGDTGDTVTMDVLSFRYSQDSIQGYFRDRTPLEDKIHMMLDEQMKPADLPPISMCEYLGIHWALDNRRLYVLKEYARRQVPPLSRLLVPVLVQPAGRRFFQRLPDGPITTETGREVEVRGYAGASAAVPLHGASGGGGGRRRSPNYAGQHLESRICSWALPQMLARPPRDMVPVVPHTMHQWTDVQRFMLPLISEEVREALANAWTNRQPSFKVRLELSGSGAGNDADADAEDDADSPSMVLLQTYVAVNVVERAQIEALIPLTVVVLSENNPCVEAPGHSSSSSGDESVLGRYTLGLVQSNSLLHPSDFDAGNAEFHTLRVVAFVHAADTAMRERLSPEHPSYRPEWFLTALESVATPLRIYDAVQQPEDLLNRHMVKATVSSSVPVWSGDSSAEDEEDGDEEYEERRTQICNTYQLNQSQAKVILRFLNRWEPAVQLVQGPPGTGKTKCLVALLDQLVHRQVPCALMCAPTNVAVGELAARFLWQSVRDEDVLEWDVLQQLDDSSAGNGGVENNGGSAAPGGGAPGSVERKQDEDESERTASSRGSQPTLRLADVLLVRAESVAGVQSPHLDSLEPLLHYKRAEFLIAGVKGLRHALADAVMAVDSVPHGIDATRSSPLTILQRVRHRVRMSLVKLASALDGVLKLLPSSTEDQAFEKLNRMATRLTALMPQLVGTHQQLQPGHVRQWYQVVTDDAASVPAAVDEDAEEPGHAPAVATIPQAPEHKSSVPTPAAAAVSPSASSRQTYEYQWHSPLVTHLAYSSNGTRSVHELSYSCTVHIAAAVV